VGSFDYQPGDVGFVPRNMGHYIENTGRTKLQFLEVWNTNKLMDVLLRQWLAFTPFELVRAHLHIDKPVLANIPTRKTPVVPA
jgi:oxalate decarboxylase